MAFNKNDIYTSSGSTMLYNAWTPYVSKFDTSSFYNWEQDNLPLYDLEERTYELWEQGGFSTSSVPGLALVVSANAAETPEGVAAMLANNNIFTEVSSCIAAIPKVVRFPVLVEVANMGDMGPLELHNFRIEEGGSIEIINRAYTPILSTSATIGSSESQPQWNKRHAILNRITCADASATLFSGLGNGAGVCTSALSISSRVLDIPDEDPRVTSVYSFIYPNLVSRTLPLAVSIDEDTPFYNEGMNEFTFYAIPYEENATFAIDGTLGTLDVSTNDPGTGVVIKRPGWGENFDYKATGSYYLNHLTKLSVKNCDGPIYIRNFAVDGKTIKDVGIEITNSNVVLERCSAARCRKAGFQFNNSKVLLSRSAFSYRNYELSSNEGRVPETGVGFHAIDSNITLSSLISGTVADIASRPGAWGASGRDVAFVASRNYAGFKLDNSQLIGGFEREVGNDENSGGVVAAEVNTGYGMLLNNSKLDLKGLVDVYGNGAGIKSNNSTFVYENLCVETNQNIGIESVNSTFLFDSRVGYTEVGQVARKQVDLTRNSQHLVLDRGASFGFSLKDNMPDKYGTMSFLSAHGVIQAPQSNTGGIVYEANIPAISIYNNSNLELIHTKLIPKSDYSQGVAGAPYYGAGIHVKNNSTASLYGSKAGCSFIWGVPSQAYQTKTAGLYADNQSILNLYGPTVIAQYGVDVLAENQSTINISPPKYRSNWYEVSAFALNDQENNASVELHSTRACLVVNKNSTLNLRDLGDYHRFWGREESPLGKSLLAVGQDYTTNEMNVSSFISSGSLQFYPNPQGDANMYYSVTAAIDSAGGVFTVPDFPKFTAKTSMNNFLVQDTICGGVPSWDERQALSLGGVCVRAVEDSVVNVTNVHFPHGNQNSPLDGYYYQSNGDLCSKLMIWNIADTSRLNAAYCCVSGMYPADVGYHGPSAIYPSSREGWDETPAGSEMTGGNENDVPASGAPSSTPDTGVLSVLDSFGAGSSVWNPTSGNSFFSPFGRWFPVSGAAGSPGGIGQNTYQFGQMNTATADLIVDAGMNLSSTGEYLYGAQVDTTATNYRQVWNNQGVFRIYWSPNPSSKMLMSDASGYFHGKYSGLNYTGAEDRAFSGILGVPYAMFAQGYNCSSNLSAVLQTDNANVSSIHPELLKLSAKSTGDPPSVTYDKWWTSGFYYCNEFLDDNPTQCMLDESASNTFANSKNASVGSSGRPKRVTLYRSRSGVDTNPAAAAYPGYEGVDANNLGAIAGSFGFKSANIFDLERDN